MGQKVVKDEPSINRFSFEFQYVVGKGGFGKVWRVILKKFKKPYALKEMSKAKIIDKKSQVSINYERELLAKIKHPYNLINFSFIVNMQYAFQDHDNLYLVMDLLTGGDLRYHVSKIKRFSEEETKFIVCCILLGLEYIHCNNILHRDIKPENLVLDDKGYVRITDFGIAKYYQKENSAETSGTPGYMAPEVMCGQNHTIAVDYFALGVLTYEFMMGFRPYTGKTRKEIKEKIMAKQAQVKKHEIPSDWSVEAADFVNRLLHRKPANRLGLRGASEVREHPWLQFYPWKDLYEKKIDPPYKPKSGDNFDANYCNNPDKIGNNTKERYDSYLRNDKVKEIFKNFTYVNMEELKIPDNSKNKKKDSKESREPKFFNPHLNITNYNDVAKNNSTINLQINIFSSKLNQNASKNESGLLSSNRDLSISGSSVNMMKKVDVSTSSIENKFLKLKKQSNSASTVNLLRQYKQSGISQNSTNTSIPYMKKSGSSNFNV